MKRNLFLALFIAGALVFALSAYAMGTKEKPTGTTQSKPQLVYFIFTGYAYPYFAPMAEAVKQASSHYPNMDVKIVNANNSASQEITAIKEAVAAGAKGIILNTIQESVTSAAMDAMKQGVPVITIDRDVSAPGARVAFIGDNDQTLGKLETQYAVNQLEQRNIPKPWHVVVLQGTLGASVTVGRLQGAMDVLQPLVDNGSVKIVLNQSADFATDKAQTMISTLLAKTSNIQLIVTGNDAEALGAINALKSHNIVPGKQTFVVGADAQPQSLAAVRDGTQLDTVTHSPFVEAYWAVEAMSNYLENGTRPPATQFPEGQVLIPMTVVSAQNVNQISDWGTPQSIPPLPYGTSRAYQVASVPSGSMSQSSSQLMKSSHSKY
jgi:ABC-type sugar transport system substrate-binding protein